MWVWWYVCWTCWEIIIWVPFIFQNYELNCLLWFFIFFIFLYNSEDLILWFFFFSKIRSEFYDIFCIEVDLVVWFYKSFCVFYTDIFFLKHPACLIPFFVFIKLVFFFIFLSNKVGIFPGISWTFISYYGILGKKDVILFRKYIVLMDRLLWLMEAFPFTRDTKSSPFSFFLVSFSELNSN